MWEAYFTQYCWHVSPDQEDNYQRASTVLTNSTLWIICNIIDTLWHLNSHLLLKIKGNSELSLKERKKRSNKNEGHGPYQWRLIQTPPIQPGTKHPDKDPSRKSLSPRQHHCGQQKNCSLQQASLGRTRDFLFMTEAVSEIFYSWLKSYQRFFIHDWSRIRDFLFMTEAVSEIFYSWLKPYQRYFLHDRAKPLTVAPFHL